MNRKDLATEAVIAAGRLRQRLGIGNKASVCPFDLATQLGISVHLMDVPSLEGMYSNRPRPAIIVGSQRPLGRKNFTCGHELGHHVFEHGYSVDELGSDNSSHQSDEEVLAQRFSGALLMPKLAVAAAFQRRNWQLTTLTSEQAYQVAQEFGVSYTGFLTHLELNLKMIPREKAQELKGESLAKIKNRIAGTEVTGNVFVVDPLWSRSTVDIEVGDLVISTGPVTIESHLVERQNEKSVIASAQGIAPLIFSGENRELQLRISEPSFNGDARYRNLEKVADDE